MSALVKQISDDQFQSDVLEASQPVLLDFWASWCGPCRAMAPVLDELAQEYAGKLLIMKMNVEENTQTPGRYEVRAIPTLLLFKNGELVGSQVGMVPKVKLAAFIEESL